MCYSINQTSKLAIAIIRTYVSKQFFTAILPQTMTFFLKFGPENQWGTAPDAPKPIYTLPEGAEYVDGCPMLNGRVLHPTEIVEERPRPFVPSVAQEDMEKAMECGALTPDSVVSALDASAAPFKRRTPTWADKARSVEPEAEHYQKHQQLLDDIAFVQLQDEMGDWNEDDEILNEAADWLEQEEKILWAPQSGIPSSYFDAFDIAHTDFIPTRTTQEVRVVRVEPMWSIASINGNSCVYLPWGSKTRLDGPPGVAQPLAHQRPLKLREFVLADLEWHPQGKNFWRATKIHPKLPTHEMLVSVVESVFDCGDEWKTLHKKGYQYTYEIHCDPAHIGSIIGKDGKNITSLIRDIQADRQTKNYDEMPSYIESDPYYHPPIGDPSGLPLPEVTITPIVRDPNEFTVPFKPTKARVRVLIPVCCIWDKAEVDKLVSFMHS